MAPLTTYTCDECTKQKGITNHWYIVLNDEFRLHIVPWSEAFAEGTNKVPKQVSHICGMECLIKLISKAAPELKVD